MLHDLGSLIGLLNVPFFLINYFLKLGTREVYPGAAAHVKWHHMFHQNKKTRKSQLNHQRGMSYNASQFHPSFNLLQVVLEVKTQGLELVGGNNGLHCRLELALGIEGLELLQVGTQILSGQSSIRLGHPSVLKCSFCA